MRCPDRTAIRGGEIPLGPRSRTERETRTRVAEAGRMERPTSDSFTKRDVTRRRAPAPRPTHDTARTPTAVLQERGLRR